MDDSILNTVKKSLGIELDYTGYDSDIILHINTALMALTQIGVGPDTGFRITDSTSKWVDFMGTAINIEAVKSYICLKVRTMFDPPANSFVMESINRETTQMEWRLMVQTDPPLPATPPPDTC